VNWGFYLSIEKLLRFLRLLTILIAKKSIRTDVEFSTTKILLIKFVAEKTGILLRKTPAG